MTIQEKKFRAFFTVIIAVCMLAGLSTPAMAEPRIIEANDKEGEPYRDAVKALLSAIGKNDKKAVKAAFIGVGDDLKLLELTVATNVARQRYNDAVRKRFNDAGPEFQDDYVKCELRVLEATTMIVNGPDQASFSPGFFPFCGFELSRRDGKWLIRSITDFPEEIPEMLAAHTKLTAAFDSLAARVSGGEFKIVADVTKAEKASVDPIIDKFLAATDKPPTIPRRR
jgi:hypothetical protein